MSYLTDLVAKASDLLTAPKPSEVRAIRSTSFDRNDFDRVLEEIPAVRKEMNALGKTVDYVEDFMGDLHSTFWKVEPHLQDREQMKASHAANRDVIGQMLKMPEVSNLRQHTVGDDYGTVMAMVSMKDVTMETVQAADEARAEAEAKAQEAQQRADEAAAQMEEFLANLPSDRDTDQLLPSADEFTAQQLQGQMDQFAQATAEVEQAMSEAQAAGQAAVDQAANNVRSQAKKTDQELTDEKALAMAFGAEPGVLQKMSVQERIDLAKKLKDNRLAKFIKLLGAFKTVQQAETRKRVINASSEIHGITRSKNLERMTAGELLNFADPTLELLLLGRYAEGNLETWDVRGKEKLGQGPIICIGDESESMTKADVAGGTREAWCKALALAMLDQAKRRKRDFIYIGFGSKGQEHVVRFPGGESDITKVIAMTEHFWKGGTHYEGPLMTALSIIEQEYDGNPTGKGRPDIVFMSDDEYRPLSEEFLTEYRRVKDKASIKTYGIAIGCSAGVSMRSLSDNVREITSLVSDPRVTGDLFRTI